MDFITAAKVLETDEKTKKERLGENFYELLDKNKQAFEFATTEDLPETKLRGGRDSATQALKILKAVSKDLRQLTDDQELYFKKVINELEQGGLPKQTSKNLLRELNEEIKNDINLRKIVAVVQKNIPSDLLKEHIVTSAAQTFGPREVILSEYFVG